LHKEFYVRSRLNDWGNVLKNTILFSGLFFILPQAMLFIFSGQTSVMVSKTEFLNDLSFSFSLAVLVSVVLLGREHFIKRKNNNA